LRALFYQLSAASSAAETPEIMMLIALELEDEARACCW